MGDPLKRALTIIIVGMGGLLIFSATGLGYLDRVLRHPAALPLPRQLAGIAITTKIQGWHATHEFANLHKKEFPLSGGAMGRYGFDGELTVWVAKAPFNWMASRMVAEMEEKIGEGNSTFTPIDEWQHQDHTVFALEGLGQTHYYLQMGNLIIWLAADAKLAGQALEEMVVFYR